MLALRILPEKRLKYDLNTYIAFVDLEKAFDRVEWKRLFNILKEIGIKYKDRRIIWNMYKNETAVYECNNCIVEARIRQGVRQGCCLSAMLFTCYIQHAMDEVRETMNDWTGIKINGIKIDMIRYTDIALTAESEDELKETLENLETILGERYNMKINKNKTKVMVVSRKELISKIKLDR